MGFRDNFVSGYMLTPVGPQQRSFAQWSLEKTLDSGLRSNQKQAHALAESLKSTFQAGISQLQDSQMQSAKLLQREIQYQSDHIIEAMSQGSSDVVAAVQNACDYLGGQLCEVRWAIECQTKISEQILQVLLKSLDNASRQYYEQGVKWYEDSEYDLARERLLLALKENSRNYFAYQYLGFIAVHRDQGEDASRNFDLAGKAADSGYHRALALSHLARSQNAAGDLPNAVQSSIAATNAAPEHARFWYESAVFYVKGSDSEHAVPCLQKAIDADLTYWSISMSDATLDPIRTRVIDLLAAIREKYRALARSVLDIFAGTIKLLQNMQIAGEGFDQETLSRFEADYAGGIVMTYKALIALVPEANVKALRAGVETTDNRKKEAQRKFRITQGEHHDKIQKQRQHLTALEKRLTRLKEAYPTWDWFSRRTMYAGAPLTVLGIMIYGLGSYPGNAEPFLVFGFLGVGLSIFWIVLKKLTQVVLPATRIRSQLVNLKGSYAQVQAGATAVLASESDTLDRLMCSIDLQREKLKEREKEALLLLASPEQQKSTEVKDGVFASTAAKRNSGVGTGY